METKSNFMSDRGLNDYLLDTQKYISDLKTNLFNRILHPKNSTTNGFSSAKENGSNTSSATYTKSIKVAAGNIG